MSSKVSRLLRKIFPPPRERTKKVKTNEYYVRVADGDDDLHFRCHSEHEARRARSLNVKEEGTVPWLRSEVRPDDIVNDIGANIGQYSLVAARRLGDEGRVFAFEPHVPTASSTISNILLNQLESRITLFTCALHEGEEFNDFNYHSHGAGSSLSQFGEMDYLGDSFQPAFSERKFGVAIDQLIERGAILPATLIKLDVDGNEPLILRGMKNLLRSGSVRALQVEISPRDCDAIMAILDECGYDYGTRHDTAGGQQLIASGENPDDVSHNVIFRRRVAAQDAA